MEVSTPVLIFIGLWIALELVLIVIGVRRWLTLSQTSRDFTGTVRWASLVLVLLLQVVGPLIFLFVITPQFRKDEPLQQSSSGSVHEIWN